MNYVYINKIKSAVFFIIIIGISFFSSCEKNKEKQLSKTVIGQWSGKQIRFPDNCACRWQNKDTSLCAALLDKEYKVLLYVDSTGCTSCKLGLAQWKHLISSTDTMDIKEKLSFLFFFHPQDKRELGFLLKRDGLDYPVFLDTTNTIDKLNHFPSDPAYQCFLLDRDNKVLAIGNPALNPKIWTLYKRIISSDNREAEQMQNTTLKANKLEYNYGNIAVNKVHPAEFILTNTGTRPLVINQVSASCGCTAANWEKKPISPGKSTRIKVEMKPDNPGNFTKTVTVHCNAESSPLVLMVKGQGID